jgi:hypothetical protein
MHGLVDIVFALIVAAALVAAFWLWLAASSPG